jgi:hypothetical protein
MSGNCVCACKDCDVVTRGCKRRVATLAAGAAKGREPVQKMLLLQESEGYWWWFTVRKAIRIVDLFLASGAVSSWRSRLLFEGGAPTKQAHKPRPSPLGPWR